MDLSKRFVNREEIAEYAKCFARRYGYLDMVEELIQEAVLAGIVCDMNKRDIREAMRRYVYGERQWQKRKVNNDMRGI